MTDQWLYIAKIVKIVKLKDDDDSGQNASFPIVTSLGRINFSLLSQNISLHFSLQYSLINKFTGEYIGGPGLGLN